ncbi:MAG: hypothetical protein OEV92_04485 [Nitrospinota bacterium]|nr:hypothetical protein [Nitrospinota bacterium]
MGDDAVSQQSDLINARTDTGAMSGFAQPTGQPISVSTHRGFKDPRRLPWVLGLSSPGWPDSIRAAFSSPSWRFCPSGV